MSRKNKNFRAWQHQNPNGTVEEAWDAAWASQQGKAYSLRINALEEALTLIASHDDWDYAIYHMRNIAKEALGEG